MTIKIILICLFTFIIHLISTLSYSVRIVGVRTRKIAISFSLFNIMVLLSRTANTFLAPLLSKDIETNIKLDLLNNNLWLFRLILISSTIATLFGVLLIPTFQRLFTIAVNSYSKNKSISRLISKFLSRPGFRDIKKSISLPKKSNVLIKSSSLKRSILRPFILNMIIVSILSVGTLSSLYAGYLVPEFRTTANSLHSIINGLATVLLYLFVDPFLSGMTDDVVEGTYPESDFRKNVVYLSIARIFGTVLAQLILIPAAVIISKIAEII